MQRARKKLDHVQIEARRKLLVDYLSIITYRLLSKGGADA